MALLARARRKLSRLLSALVLPEAVGDRFFVQMAYRQVLRRPADPEGLAFYLGQLAAGTMTREHVLAAMTDSNEFAELGAPDLFVSLHKSRRQWISGLPPARRILDLGGSCKDSPAGAMLFMGYPYGFDEMIILDLPLEQRHALASEGYEMVEQYDSEQGPVRYIYGSMTDLGQFGDASLDMVHSGQSIEHISQADAEQVLAQALRILKPGGHLCLDTPNRAATRLHSEGWMHPEHQFEYTHEQLAAKLEAAGFEIMEAKGLNYLPRSLASGDFDAAEAASNQGVFSDIARCYTLVYICRKPA